MKIYAAYGSNMNLKQMARRCPEARLMGVGTLNDYKLCFRGNGHANIKVCKGLETPIVLWEVTPRCERALDAYEGYPRYYIKKEVKIQIEDREVKAIAYVMAKSYEDKISAPTAAYYNVIYEGYMNNNISVEALKDALSS